MKAGNKSLIAAMTGLVLFFLVLSVLYTVLYLSNAVEKNLQIFFPLIVLCGFFIFLVAAMLLAFAIYSSIKNKL